MADIDNVTVGENNYNLRDSAAQNALPTQGQVDDIITALNTIANKTDHPYDPDNKLPSDYVNDANQTHKFATQAQLTQIETNKNNILLIEQMNGAKNFLNFDADTMKSINTGGTWSGNTWSIGNNVTLTINADKSITLNGTANNGKTIYLAKNLGMTENAYTLSTGALTTKLWAGIIEVGGTENNYTGSTTHIDKTCQPNHINLYIESGCTLSNFTVYPMLTLKSLYDAGFTNYQPYALPNTTLTPALQECVDNGKKNLSTFETGTNSSANKWVTGSGGTDVTCNLLAGKTYIISFTTNYSGSTAQGQLSCKATDNTDINSPTTAISSSCLITFTPAKDIKSFGLYINEGGITVTNFMVCEKTLHDVSPQFEPYAMSNAELTERSMIVLRPSGNLTDQTVNTYQPNTIVNGYADSINGKTGWVTIVTQQLNGDGTRLFQNAIFSDGTTFTRFYNGTWGAWTNPLTNPKSGSVTWATGYTPSTSEVRIRQYGNIVCGQIYALFSDALPASTETTVGTITGVDKAGASVRLSVGVAPSQLYGTPTGMAYCFISSSTGSIVLKTRANETGKAFCINFTYTTADPA